MKKAFVIVALCGMAMLAAVTYAIVFGRGWSEVRSLMSYPWFRMSMVDIYVGFILVALWIWFRESSALVAALCTVSLLLLGNLFACGYVLWALASSQGNWREFWMGWRASE